MHRQAYEKCSAKSSMTPDAHMRRKYPLLKPSNGAPGNAE